MKNIVKLLILNVFIMTIGASSAAFAEEKSSWFGWSRAHEDYLEQKQYNPYLEDPRHVQIPQWSHEDWYAEDWTSQKDGLSLINGFYKADILRDQTVRKGTPVLVVGPNFYHLSGYDKRRVVHVVDVVYGITDRADHSAFLLRDWHTKKTIGVFDHEGLRLH